MNQREVGERFRPTIKYMIGLLQFKAAGGGDISDCTEFPKDMCYRNLYGPGKEPWKLFSGEHEIWELHQSSIPNVKEKYVLTDLPKLGVKNVSRTAGAGTWHDGSTPNPVEYDGREMGYWKTLSYEYWGDDGAGKPYYYMNELHLSEYALSQVRAKRDDYVICRVLKNESKRCRMRRGKKRLSQDQDDDCPITQKKKKLNQASCSQVVPEEEAVDDDDIGECIDFPSIEEADAADLCGFEQNQPQQDDDDDIGECIDFAGIEEADVVDLFGFEQNQPQQVASSFASESMQGACGSELMQGNCDPQLLSIPEYSGPGYVPEMSSESWDHPEMQPNWVADHDSFAEGWDLEDLELDEILKFLNNSENGPEIC